MAVIGFMISGAVTLVLSIIGMLQGPSLLPWGGPAFESLVAANVGASIGFTPSVLRFDKVSDG